MNKSWKTNTAGIASIVAGVANLVIAGIREGMITNESAGIAVTAIIAGVGLLNAKDNNVSNAPIPLASGQVVTESPVHAEAPGSIVAVPNPAVPVAPVAPHKF
jgi:hypothetical protein